jgi:hypothetical protein
MSETNLGRRDLLLASGAVLASAGAAARATEKPSRLFVLHPQSPEAPRLPGRPA